MAKPKKAVKPGKQSKSAGAKASIQSWLQLGLLRSEKCELKEARIAYSMALKEARKAEDYRGIMEAVSGLLRLAGESVDEEAIAELGAELDAWMTEHPKHAPPAAWYCKGNIARYRKQFAAAQRYFHHYLRAVRRDPKSVSYANTMSVEEALAKGWINLASIWAQKGKLNRSKFICNALLNAYEGSNFRGINGIIYIQMGDLAEREKDFEAAWNWFKKAHASFLREHNWYYHLYVLYRYARLSRIQQNFSQSYWYLDLVENATAAPEFTFLRQQILGEKSRLEQDAVDLLIDSRQGVIKTREQEPISIGKQYVLLHILEALTKAHKLEGDDQERGLSKAEIIQYVWNENYRPEAHDNKLYYNINRLRKLIEPDVRKPQYLLNWKEGYRLAPGLRIQFIGASNNPVKDAGKVKAVNEGE